MGPVGDRAEGGTPRGRYSMCVRMAEPVAGLRTILQGSSMEPLRGHFVFVKDKKGIRNPSGRAFFSTKKGPSGHEKKKPFVIWTRQQHGRQNPWLILADFLKAPAPGRRESANLPITALKLY